MSRDKLIGVALAFLGGFFAALSVVATDGIVQAEVFQAVAAGFTTAIAYYKVPAK